MTVSAADGEGIWIARAGMDLQHLLPEGSSTTIHRSPASRLPIALSDDGSLAFVEGNQIWQFSSEPGILIRGFTTGGGTIVTDPSGPYLSNTVVQVTARPEPGWDFLGWQGDVDTEAAAVSVTADRHQTLNAAFGLGVVVPPAIVARPSNLTVQAGSSVEFLVEAIGGSPLEYQWHKDGAEIPGAMQ